MVLACTGGGIMVPIFINSIPVPLAQDAYPIAIFISFMLHSYFPIIRDVLELSPVFKVGYSTWFVNDWHTCVIFNHLRVLNSGCCGLPV